MKQKANNCKKLNMFLWKAVHLSHFVVCKPNNIFIELQSVFPYVLFKFPGLPLFEANLIIENSDLHIPKILLLVLHPKRPPQDPIHIT
jgi:hypothetical protein